MLTLAGAAIPPHTSQRYSLLRLIDFIHRDYTNQSVANQPGDDPKVAAIDARAFDLVLTFAWPRSPSTAFSQAGHDIVQGKVLFVQGLDGVVRHLVSSGENEP